MTIQKNTLVLPIQMIDRHLSDDYDKHDNPYWETRPYSAPNATQQ